MYLLSFQMVSHYYNIKEQFTSSSCLSLSPLLCVRLLSSVGPLYDNKPACALLFVSVQSPHSLLLASRLSSSLHDVLIPHVTAATQIFSAQISNATYTFSFVCGIGRTACLCCSEGISLLTSLLPYSQNVAEPFWREQQKHGRATALW